MSLFLVFVVRLLSRRFFTMSLTVPCTVVEPLGLFPGMLFTGT